MDKALYVSMTGGKHIARAQAIHSNNMANASTAGFRADYAQARAMAIYEGSGYETRAYALAENPGTDFAYGSLQQTGGELDIAVDGPGWIAVQGANGQEGYTRAGSLRVNAQGQLQTADGHNVLGDGGPITLPPLEKVDIGFDGTITVREQGQAPSALGQLGRLKLVNPNNAQLSKGEDGLMYLRPGQAALKADENLRVRSGFVEGSNVNVVDEFTQVMALARQFDMHMKMMRTTEDNSAAATKLLQVS
ncbi:MAG: flagellar basal-body rod protein FlgF [Spongiibacteraceae bacterium]